MPRVISLKSRPLSAKLVQVEPKMVSFWDEAQTQLTKKSTQEWHDPWPPESWGTVNFPDGSIGVAFYVIMPDADNLPERFCAQCAYGYVYCSDGKAYAFSETPEPIRGVFAEDFAVIHGEFAHLIRARDTFLNLFDGGREKVELLTWADEEFFNQVFNFYLEGIALGFCRLLDPPETGRRGSGNENLSLDFLLNRTELAQHGSAKEWKEKLRAINGSAKVFRQFRNKRIAHLSYRDFGKGSKTYSRKDVESVSDAIAELLNDIRSKQNPPLELCDYSLGAAGAQYGRPLLLHLGSARAHLQEPPRAHPWGRDVAT